MEEEKRQDIFSSESEEEMEMEMKENAGQDCIAKGWIPFAQ